MAVGQGAPDLRCRWQAQVIAAKPGAGESYEVPFELAVEGAAGGLRAALVNGSDRMEFSRAAQQGGVVTLRLEQYDATLTAHCTSGTTKCAVLEGEYVRQRGASVSRLAFHASCESGARQETKGAPGGTVAGQWQFRFRDSEGKAPSEAEAAANFTQQGQRAEGTIAPVSGDYGMMAGEVVGGEVHLSRFDGIHALRLDGKLVSAERMEGVFHVAAGMPLSFVATRSGASAAGFEEAEHLTTVANPAEKFLFHGTDESGATVTQDGAEFRGKVVVVDIFGTWCPNCHDEAPVLEEMYRRFHGRGLEIVGLSYEYVDDAARSHRLLGIYRRKYGIEFPLLLAGTTEAGQIGKTLPQLRNFGAYPTTIFLDRHGRVRVIHAGFSGPATGQLEELKKRFESTIVKLLDEQ